MGYYYSAAAASASSPTPELLWWKMSDGSGTAVTAAVGPNGTTGADWVTGLSGSGNALDFNGTSDGLSSNSTIAFGTNILTVCLLVNLDSTSGTQILAESSANFGANPVSWAIYIDSGNLVCGIAQTGPLFRLEQCAAPSTGVTVALAVVFDRTTTSGNITIYYDGSSQTTTVPDNSLNSTTDFTTRSVYVGARNNASLWANGRIDDVRIYSRALNSTEIAQVRDDKQ